jgi:hypothetical protein
VHTCEFKNLEDYTRIETMKSHLSTAASQILRSWNLTKNNNDDD